MVRQAPIHEPSVRSESSKFIMRNSSLNDIPFRGNSFSKNYVIISDTESPYQNVHLEQPHKNIKMYVIGVIFRAKVEERKEDSLSRTSSRKTIAMRFDPKDMQLLKLYENRFNVQGDALILESR